MQVDFDTLIAHVADIVIEAGVTERRSVRYAGYKTDSTVVVVLDATIETILEHAEVKARVELCTLLPAQLLVLTQCRRNKRNSTITVYNAVTVGVVITIQTTIVTVLTVTDLELQLVKPLCLCHKLLLGNHPTEACTPEYTPTVIRMEGRRTLSHD